MGYDEKMKLESMKEMLGAMAPDGFRKSEYEIKRN